MRLALSRFQRDGAFLLHFFAEFCLMQRALIIIAALATIAAFSSCKKCTTCYLEWDAAGNTERFDYEEVCGKKGQIEDYRQACIDAAEAAGGTCTCAD